MMPPSTQGPSSTVKVASLRKAWSDARWDSLNPGLADDAELLQWHLWATAAQSAVMPAVAVLELTLRNALFLGSTEILAARPLVTREINTWLDANPSMLRDRDQREVDEAKSRLRRRKGKLTVGRLVAELDFGFWTGLFDSCYDHSTREGAALWPWLRKKAFPGAPKGMQTRGDLAKHFHSLRDLRNSIVHHKHFWKAQGICGVFDTFSSTIGWMNRSAQIALETSTRPWIEELENVGHAKFDALAKFLVSQPALLGDGQGHARSEVNTARNSPFETLQAENEDLPF